MLPVRLILTPKNRLSAEPTRDEPLARYLVQFLNGDIAEDSKHCQVLIEAGAEVLSGKKADWKASGNAFGLTLTGKTTEIRPLHTKDAAVTLSTSELVDLVAQWQGLLGRPAV